MSRVQLAMAIMIATLGFVDSANATNSRAQGKAGQRATCHDKVGAKPWPAMHKRLSGRSACRTQTSISDGASCLEGRLRGLPNTR